MKLITNPDEFFEELKHRDVRIKIPLLTVMIPLAILLSAYQYVLATKLAQAFPPELARFFLVGAYIGIVGSFIGVFAVWLILAVIMHGISSFFGGRGSFRRTFEFTSYGFFPSLVGSIITVPMSAYYISKAEIPKISITQLQQNPSSNHLEPNNLELRCETRKGNRVKEGFHYSLNPDRTVRDLSGLVDIKAAITFLFCLQFHQTLRLSSMPRFHIFWRFLP